MTYAACLEYLYQALPMYQRIGNAAFKKSLDNILALCDALGQPHLQFKTIHVAGTNGKGSSSHMLAAVLQQSGYKTGLYTSPHLKSFTERIRINGQELPQDYLITFVEQHKALFESIKPSFFEMTVALAFNYFADSKVNVAVIEVGLGGRLDSTNIITPELSLITNISFDHQSLLGDTLEQIAAEKAGIIKTKVPAVVSTLQPEIEAVFRTKASQVAAPLYFASTHFAVTPLQADVNQQVFDVHRDGELYLQNLSLDLTGTYQQFNLPGVLQALAILTEEQDFHISEEALRSGLAHTKSITGLKGRWQVLQEQPLLICDTGHNEDGLRQVLAQLASFHHKRLHFVFGTVNDKDISKILALLPPQYVYYFCQATIPRALPIAELREKAEAIGLKGTYYTTVAQAITAAKENAAPDEVIFVGGSNFVVAEIEEL